MVSKNTTKHVGIVAFQIKNAVISAAGTGKPLNIAIHDVFFPVNGLFQLQVSARQGFLGRIIWKYAAIVMTQWSLKDY